MVNNYIFFIVAMHSYGRQLCIAVAAAVQAAVRPAVRPAVHPKL
jgi:hypothetical protein